MSAQVTITQLPAAGPITGTESVPIVQNGQTVQTTTGAIAASPSQAQTFLTLNTEASLPNSRYLSSGLGVGLTDGGAQSFYRITLNRASGSLEAASPGFIAKDSASSVVSRIFQTSGSGLTLINGNGVTGNPTLSLSGQVFSLANASGAGLVALPNNGSVVPRTIQGTANEIDVVDGDGASGNPTIGLSDNPTIPGVEYVKVPVGGTADRPSGAVNGMFRYNTDISSFEGYAAGAWGQIISGLGVTSVNASGGMTGLTFTGGPITSAGVLTLGGTLDADNGGTGLSSYSVGDLLYASGAAALSRLALGTATYVLTAGASAPQYVAQSSLSVGYATSAGSASTAGTATSAVTATNIANGTAGSIVYQIGSGSTSTLPLGTATYVLAAGLSAPEYVSQASLSVGSAATATTAATATNIAGGATGSILYQGGTGSTTSLALGTATYVLVAGASAPEYAAQSSLSVGFATTAGSATTAGTATTATTASNLAGGAASQIPYQTGPGGTSFIPNGNAGQVLTSAGAGTPVWSGISGGTF